jgi:23S rRNA (uracil1939-C5)-methyltransferase
MSARVDRKRDSHAIPRQREDEAVERVAITGIAAGGAGVARLADGIAVFVPRTAPGDESEITVVDRRARWARGRLVRTLEDGQGRRRAPCPLYSRCGGCTLQHLEPAAQRRAKSRLVADAMGRIAHLPLDAPFVEYGEKEFHYRNRLSFTLLRLNGRVVAGFHEVNRPERILDVDARCLLPEPAIGMAWSQLREAWGPGARRLPSGSKLRLTLRAVESGEVSLTIDGGEDDGDARALLAGAPAITSVWHRRKGEVEPVLIAGAESLAESWLGDNVALTGTTFLQVNREAARLLESYVLERAGAVDGHAVVDAYCGIGTRARALAGKGASVTGIELDPQAVREARRLAGGPSYIEARVEEALPTVLPADLVLLNPPRTGIEGTVAEGLSRTPPRRILYVSCDPATLARDIARLAGTFTVHELHCFDLFPQTSHVETVAELVCAIS